LLIFAGLTSFFIRLIRALKQDEWPFGYEAFLF
jgi:hypothetical protein